MFFIFLLFTKQNNEICFYKVQDLKAEKNLKRITIVQRGDPPSLPVCQKIDVITIQS